MNTEKKEISAEAKKKAEEALKERVPVQQTASHKEATQENIQKAVRELNPDMSGLDRG